jgi:hypothetical protein
MFIKIKTPGWETYTGELGMAQFENGVSIEHISSREAYSLGAMLDVVELNNDGSEGNPVSHAFDLVKGNSITATVVPDRPRLSEVLAAEAKAKADAGDEISDPNVRYTREDLEKIADLEGIGGIRKISDPLKIKGVAIKTLISEILLHHQPVAA